MKKISVEGLCVILFIFIHPFGAFAGSNASDEYYEDLSILRPSYVLPVKVNKKNEPQKNECKKQCKDIKPLHHVSEILGEFLVLKKDFFLRKKNVECYTIQIYSGKNRFEAFSILKKINAMFPNPYIQYLDSNYIVRIGKCINKIELCEKYVQIMKIFPNIIIRSVLICREEVLLRGEEYNLPNDEKVAK